MSVRLQGSRLLLGGAALALSLLFLGAAPAVARVDAPLTVKASNPPIPKGFKLVASDRGNKADYWAALASVFSVDYPVAVDIRVSGTGTKPSTQVHADCGDAQYDTLPESKHAFKGFGLFSLQVPAAAANCAVTATATGSSGTFTVQVYVRTNKPTTTTPTTPGTTTPTPTSPSKAYDGTWQGRIYGTVVGAPNSQGLEYSAYCCDAWSFTVSDGEISGGGTSGSISSAGAATITITSESAYTESSPSGPYSIVCTFQAQFTSTSATSSPISCEADGYTLTGDFKASPETPTTTPTTPTTTTTTASPYCVKSNDGSSNGWNYYKYVDTTSTAPCYGHWTITLGPGCQFEDGDGHGWYASGPANVWNIVRWGYSSGGTVAYLADRRILEWSCTINAASYPQTTLNPLDWR